MGRHHDHEQSQRLENVNGQQRLRNVLIAVGRGVSSAKGCSGYVVIDGWDEMLEAEDDDGTGMEVIWQRVDMDIDGGVMLLPQYQRYLSNQDHRTHKILEVGCGCASGRSGASVSREFGRLRFRIARGLIV